MSQRVGLIGYPIEHSLSPAFQQAAFDALGIDARYELWPTLPEHFAERVAGLRHPDAIGANVTVPHKTRAFDEVNEVSDLAQEAGAVNTIINRDGRLIGDNTDIPGFLAPLQQSGINLSSASVVVLGAGGAARAVVVAVRSAGCEQVLIANRTAERAESLAKDLGGAIKTSPLDSSLAQHLGETSILVNATAIGWDDSALPLDEELLDALPPSALVYDLTYRETPLLRAASQRGLAMLDGFQMLVQQGAASFRLWTGQEPPIDTMLEAARTARSRAT